MTSKKISKDDLEKEIETFQALQSSQKKLQNQDITLRAQLSENVMVKRELEHLTDKDEIFKLVGPVLISQNLSNSKENVEKRIELIQTQLKNLETENSKFEKNMKERQEKILRMQDQFKLQNEMLPAQK